MKKATLFILILVSLNSYAQKNKWERIKALKVSFITEQLDLTEKESQKFWPVYNDYNNMIHVVKYTELKAIRKEIRKNRDTMSNDEAKDLIERLTKSESKLQKLKMDYYTKCLQIIPPKKVILLKLAEEDFRKKMLEQYKKNKQGKH